jgi:hypothetical protein
MVSGLRRSQKSFSPYMPVDDASAGECEKIDIPTTQSNP